MIIWTHVPVPKSMHMRRLELFENYNNIATLVIYLYTSYCSEAVVPWSIAKWGPYPRCVESRDRPNELSYESSHFNIKNAVLKTMIEVASALKKRNQNLMYLWWCLRFGSPNNTCPIDLEEGSLRCTTFGLGCLDLDLYQDTYWTQRHLSMACSHSGLDI